MKKILLIVVKSLSGLLLLILLLIGLIIGLFFLLNKTGHINNIALSFMNRHIAGEMRFDSLHFNFSDFPDIRVNASNGLLISGISDPPGDTLCHFEKLEATMNPFKIYTDTLISIPYVYLTKPYAKVEVSADRHPGWAIWRFRKPVPSVPGEKKKKKPIKLDIAYVRIYGHPELHFANYHSGMKINACADSLIMLGRIAINYKKLDVDYLNIRNLRFRIDIPRTPIYLSTLTDSLHIVKTSTQAVSNYRIQLGSQEDTLRLGNHSVFEGADFEVHGGISAGIDYKLILLNHFFVDLDNNFMMLNGTLRKQPYRKAMTANMSLYYHSTDLNQTLSLIPVASHPPMSGMSFDFPINLRAEIAGTIWPKGKIFPEFDLWFNIPRGTFSYRDWAPFRNLSVHLDGRFDPNKRMDIDINLSKCAFDLMNSHSSMRGRIQALPTNPVFDLNIASTLQLSDLKALTGLQKLPVMDGRAKIDMDVRFPLSDLKALNTRNLFAKGSISIQQPAVRLLDPDMDIHASDIGIDFLPIYVPPETPPETPDSLAVRLTVKKLNSVSAGFIRLQADTIGLTSVIPVLTSVKHALSLDGNFEIAGVTGIYGPKDSVEIDLMKIDFGAYNLRDTVSLPRLDIRMMGANMLARADSTTIICSDLGFDLGAIRSYPRLPKHPKMPVTHQILNDWDFHGSVVIGQTRYLSPVLPLDNKLDELQITFNANDLFLKDIHLQSGESDLQVDGVINNWRNYILKGGILSADINVGSDSLDMSELIPAIARGVLNSQKRNGEGTDSLVKRIFPPNFIPPKNEKHRSKEKLILIPPDINACVNLDAKNVRYETLKLDSATGQILMTDRRLVVNDIRFRSEIGSIDVVASYNTPTIHEASTDLTLRARNLDVHNIITMIPDLPALVPMLTTLEGSVGCDVTARAKLDSAMYIELPSLYSVARIHGTHLSVEKEKVLPRFVGWLLFGRKKDIFLDSINVELMVKDSIVSVYPFVADLGRYRVLATGVQHLDQSFFYHFSLLKWPLLIPIGFNVYGRPHQLHFRLACPKLKSLELPAKILSTKETSLYPARNVTETITTNTLQQQKEYRSLYRYYETLIQTGPPPITHDREEKLRNQLDKLKKEIEAD